VAETDKERFCDEIKTTFSMSRDIFFELGEDNFSERGLEYAGNRLKIKGFMSFADNLKKN